MDPYRNDSTMLFLRLFKKHALTQGWVELHEFNLSFCGFSILASPDNVVGLRGLESKKAVLRHVGNVTRGNEASKLKNGSKTWPSGPERDRFSACSRSLCDDDFFYVCASRLRRAFFLHIKMRFVIFDGNRYGTALHQALRDHE